MTAAAADLVVLAYSGGLDTTVSVHRLTHEQGRAVVALLADVGQGEDLPALADRALAAGAVDAVVVDARERFATDFLVPAIRANARYEGRYPLVSALSRPLIAQLLVEEAGRRGAAAPQPSPTAAPARATTRSASRSAAARSPPT
jgi:argininosuccinate synthase